MSGNRFVQFKPQEHVSQYVPLPLDLLAKIGEKKQNEIDVTKAKLDEFSSNLNIKPAIGFEDAASKKEKYYTDKLAEVRTWFMANKGNTSGAAEKMAALGREFNTDKDIEMINMAAAQNPLTLAKLESVSQKKGGANFVDRTTGNVKQFGLQNGIATASNGRTYTSFTPAMYGYYEKGDWEKDAGALMDQIEGHKIQQAIDAGDEIIELPDGSKKRRDQKTQVMSDLLTEQDLIEGVQPYLESLNLGSGTDKVSQTSFLYRINEGLYDDGKGGVDSQKLQDDLVAYGKLRLRKNTKNDYQNTTTGGSGGGSGSGDDEGLPFNYVISTAEETTALIEDVTKAPDDKKVTTVEKMFKYDDGTEIFRYSDKALDDPEAFKRVELPHVVDEIYNRKIALMPKEKSSRLIPEEKEDMKIEARMKAEETYLYWRAAKMLERNIKEEFKDKDLTSVKQTIYLPQGDAVDQRAQNMADYASGTNSKRSFELETNKHLIDYQKRLNEEYQNFFGEKNTTRQGLFLTDDLSKSDGGKPEDKILGAAISEQAIRGDNVYYKGEKIEGVMGKMQSLFEGKDIKSETLDALESGSMSANFNPTLIFPKFEMKNGIGTYTWMAEGQFEVNERDINGVVTKQKSNIVSVQADDIIRQNLGNNVLVESQMSAMTQKEVMLMPPGATSIINVGGMKYPVKRGVTGMYILSGEVPMQTPDGKTVITTFEDYSQKTGFNMTKAYTPLEASQKINEAAMKLAHFKNQEKAVDSKDWGLMQVNDKAHTQETQTKVWGKYIAPSQMTAEQNLEYAAALKNFNKGWNDWSTYKNGAYSNYYDEIYHIKPTDSNYIDRVSLTLGVDKAVIKKVTEAFKDPKDWSMAISIMMAESAGNQSAQGTNYKKP